jgi:hypothetical protein
MPPYPISCYKPGCPHLARYKIAAEWSDGITHELKTYALCCADCLAELYRQSCRNQAACRLAAGETLQRPGIYEMVRGLRDQQLMRLPDLEKQLQTAPVSDVE